MGLSFSSESVLKNIQGLRLNQSQKLQLEKVDYLKNSSIFSSASADAQKEMEAIDSINDLINIQFGKADALENPMEKMFSVQEFIQDKQGMCGMGMGMGSFKGASVQLTGAELLALSSVLSEGTGTQEDLKDWDSKIEKLQSAGIDAKEGTVYVDNNGNRAKYDENDPASVAAAKAKVASGELKELKGIEICHKDGTKTTVFDANGNGGLDSQDYNFNAALAEFKCDLKEYKDEMNTINAEVNKLEGQRDGHEQNLSGDNALAAAVKGLMSKILGNANRLQEEVDQLDTTYKQTQFTMATLATKNSQADADHALKMTETAGVHITDAEKVKGELKDAGNISKAAALISEMKAELEKAKAEAAKAQEYANSTKEASNNAKANIKPKGLEPEEAAQFEKEADNYVASALEGEVAARTAKESVQASLIKIYELKQKVQELANSEKSKK